MESSANSLLYFNSRSDTAKIPQILVPVIQSHEGSLSLQCCQIIQASIGEFAEALKEMEVCSIRQDVCGNTLWLSHHAKEEHTKTKLAMHFPPANETVNICLNSINYVPSTIK